MPGVGVASVGIISIFGDGNSLPAPIKEHWAGSTIVTIAGIQVATFVRCRTDV